MKLLSAVWRFIKWLVGPVLIFLCGVVVGTCTTLLIAHWGLLTLEHTATVGNVLQASATVLTGLVVAWFINRSIQVDRKEKDLLLRHTDRIDAMLQEFEEFKDGGSLTEIAASVKRINTACLTLKEVLPPSYPSKILTDLDFPSSVKSLRELSTDTPIGKIEQLAETASPEVKDGIMKLTTERKERLNTELHAFRLRVFKLQVAINKC